MNSGVAEYDAIAETMQHYINGARSGRSDDMKPAFHEGATVLGYAGQDLEAASIQEFFAWHDDNGAAPDIRARITSIDLAWTIATVRVDIDNWQDDRYTDMFTLLKIDGQWKIINKVFHLHAAAE